MPEVSPLDWEKFIKNNPDAHLLQSRAWGELKSIFGWQAHYFIVRTQSDHLGAQVLLRRIPFGWRIAYIPRGPVGLHNHADRYNPLIDQFWSEIDTFCKKQRSVFLHVEPDIWIEDNIPLPSRFIPAVQTIQPPRTLVIDLKANEDEIIGRMKQKTRYNIRLAQRKGVVVEPSTDIKSFYHLMVKTGERDQFGVHSYEYYENAYYIFSQSDNCKLLNATYNGMLLASLMVFKSGKRAWYFYGASSDEYRELMPTYLLQWEAIRWAKSQNCEIYDLWGVPDYDLNYLEDNFTKRHEGLWGVYRFKRGFGGVLKRAAGPRDRIFQTQLYRFYGWWMRRRNKTID